jgi:hypothetical protein
VGEDQLPVIRLHDLRHTHATLLLAADEPVKVVSERLDHANATIALAVYQLYAEDYLETQANLSPDRRDDGRAVGMPSGDQAQHHLRVRIVSRDRPGATLLSRRRDINDIGQPVRTDSTTSSALRRRAPAA